MDSYDDLLNSNLEENPFATHQGRSNSPDPWASYTTQNEFEDDAHPFHDGQSTFHQPQPVHDPYKSHSDINDHDNSELNATPRNEVVNLPPQIPSLDSVDPLDTAAVNAEIEELPVSPRRKPTFRQYDAPISDAIAPVVKVNIDSSNHATTGIESEPKLKPEVTHESASLSSSPKVSIATARDSQTISQYIAKEDSPKKSGSTSLPPSVPDIATTSISQSVPVPVISPLERPEDRGFASLANPELGWQTQHSNSPWIHQNIQSSNAQQPLSALSLSEDDEDDDDDQPILKRAKSPTVPPQKREKGLHPVFVISVDDPQKVGDPIRGYTMYTVHTKTTSPLFAKSSFSVLRRFSDFLWLTETLTYSHPGVIVPSAPSKAALGRFDSAFVSQRRQALNICINKIANHPVLGVDPDLKLFLESDGFVLEVKQRRAELAREGKAGGGIMASIGIGPRFYESDEWFEKQKVYLDSLEVQLRGFVKSIELVAKQRTGANHALMNSIAADARIEELSVATAVFATSISDLSTSEQLSKPLSVSLTSLANTEHKSQDLQLRQAQADVSSLFSTADEYARLIGSVRLAFAGRARTWALWQAAEAEVKKAQDAKERSRMAGESIANNRTLMLLEDAHRRSAAAKHEYDQCAKLIKSELASFEQERVEDFKDALNEFLEGMISRQKEIISHWESHQSGLLKRVQSPTTRIPASAVVTSTPPPASVDNRAERPIEFAGNQGVF